jgi:hypothetical protein
MIMVGGVRLCLQKDFEVVMLTALLVKVAKL